METPEKTCRGVPRGGQWDQARVNAAPPGACSVDALARRAHTLAP